MYQLQYTTIHSIFPFLGDKKSSEPKQSNNTEYKKIALEVFEGHPFTNISCRGQSSNTHITKP